jgi:hypothetical protein
MRNDIYTKSGVWDLNAAQVIPVCHPLRLFFYVILATRSGCYGLRLTGLGFPMCSSSLRLGSERRWMMVIDRIDRMDFGIYAIYKASSSTLHIYRLLK